jgi:predicted PurR-regulated permease PerM
MNGSRRLNNPFLLILLVLSLVGLVRVVHVFLLDIVIAAVFATLFYPLYRRIRRYLGGRQGWSALACSLILLIGFLLPVILIAEMVVAQAAELSQTAVPQVRALLQPGAGGLVGKIRETRLFEWVAALGIDWEASLAGSLQMVGAVAARIINRTSQAALGFVFDLFVVFFTLFYFFRDGEVIVRRASAVIPLDPAYQRRILERFTTISRATIRGTLLIGLIQGTLGGLILLLLGTGTWLLWGVAIVLLSVIPILGAWTVLVPVAIVKIAGGQVWQGIAVIIFTTGILALIDNIIRPVLVGRGGRMHDLLVFFTTLGGLGLFGATGFIIGPMIAALFLTLVDIYSVEFNVEGAAAPGLTKEQK